MTEQVNGSLERAEAPQKTRSDIDMLTIRLHQVGSGDVIHDLNNTLATASAIYNYATDEVGFWTARQREMFDTAYAEVENKVTELERIKAEQRHEQAEGPSPESFEL